MAHLAPFFGAAAVVCRSIWMVGGWLGLAVSGGASTSAHHPGAQLLRYHHPLSIKMNSFKKSFHNIHQQVVAYPPVLTTLAPAPQPWPQGSYFQICSQPFQLLL